MIRRVLVANRGEIAVRIVRACHDEGLAAIAAVSEADVGSLVTRMADHTVTIGPATPAQSYLSVGAIISAAMLMDCDAIHPGYGFLSERPELAEACERHGMTFIGPSAASIRRGGDKVQARALAESLSIPVGEGSQNVRNADEALATAAEVGYPVLLKAAAGGGGRGMIRVDDPGNMREQFARTSLEAQSAFGDGRIYLERFVTNARHVEVQVLADTHGACIHLGDRDCSIQRRYQKLVEEAPATAIPAKVRQEIAEAAIRLVRALDYQGAATVEFLVDRDRGTFAFLEINTRLQVEHPVTEIVTGIDIVRAQLRIAAGEALDIPQESVTLTGHAIECRINAESAAAGFAPAPGLIGTWVMPEGSDIRVDTHCFPGYSVPPFYDSLLAKFIVSGPERISTLDRLAGALARIEIGGIETTVPFHAALLAHPDLREDRTNTRWVEDVFLPTWSETHSQEAFVGGAV